MTVRNCVGDGACISSMPDCLRRKWSSKGYPRIKMRYEPAKVLCRGEKILNVYGALPPESGQHPPLPVSRF